MAEGKFRVVYKDSDDGQAKVKEFDTEKQAEAFVARTPDSDLLRYAVSIPGSHVPCGTREETEEYIKQNGGDFIRRKPWKELSTPVYDLYWRT